MKGMNNLWVLLAVLSRVCLVVCYIAMLKIPVSCNTAVAAVQLSYSMAWCTSPLIHRVRCPRSLVLTVAAAAAGALAATSRVVAPATLAVLAIARKRVLGGPRTRPLEDPRCASCPKVANEVTAFVLANRREDG